MKIKKVIQKVQEDVAIPDKLLKFLKTNIYQAFLNNQDEAVLESDDGIQTEFACAGLIDSESKIFVVTYYPEEGSPYRWHFNIFLDELKQIFDSTKTTLTLWKCGVAGCQNKSDVKDSICLIHDFVDDGSGDSDLVKNIHNLSVKQMLNLAYGPKKK